MRTHGQLTDQMQFSSAGRAKRKAWPHPGSPRLAQPRWAPAQSRLQEPRPGPVPSQAAEKRRENSFLLYSVKEQKKMWDICAIIFMAVSRCELCYASGNKGFRSFMWGANIFPNDANFVS